MTLAQGIIGATLLFLCSSTLQASTDKSSLTSQLTADSSAGASLRFTRQTGNTNSGGGSQALSLLDLPVFSRGDRPNYMDKTLGAIFSKVAFAQPPNQTSSTANPKNEVLDPVDEVPQPAMTTITRLPLTTTVTAEPTTQKSSVFEFDTRVFDFVPFERLDPNNSPGLRGPTRVNATKTSDPSGVIRVRTSTAADNPPMTTPTTTATTAVTPTEPTADPTESLPTTTPKAFTTSTPARETSSPWGDRDLAWGVQVYGSSSLFLFLGVFVLTCLCRLRSSSRKLLSTSHCLSIQLLVLFLSITRAIHLLYDPYNHRRLLPPALAFSIFNVAFPCLSSALAVLLLGIFKATKLQALPSILLKPPIWAFLVAFHFALSLSIDIVVGSVGGLYTLHLASQAYFVLWSLALSLGFFAAYGPASRAAIALQTESLRATLTAMHIHGSSLPRRLPRPTLIKAVRVTLAASVFTVLVSAFQLYGMFGVYGLPWRQQNHPSSVKAYVATQPVLTQELLARYREKNLNVDALKEALGLNHTHEMKSHDKHREIWPVASEHFWPWWTYQLIARILEFLVAILVAYAASQPQKTQEVIHTDVNKPRSMWIFAGRSFKSSSMETLSSLCCQTNKLMRTREVNQDIPIKAASDIPVRGFIYANPPITPGSCVPVSVEYASNGTPSGSIYGSRRSQRRGPACEVSARHVYQELEQKNSIPSMSYYSTSSMTSSTQYYEPSVNQLRYDMQMPNTQLLTMLSKESRVYHPNVYGNRHMDHVDESHHDRLEEVNQDVYLSQCTSTCSSESAGNSFDLRFFPARTSPKRSSAMTMRSSLRTMEPAVYPVNPNFHRSLPPGSRNFKERSPDSDHTRELTKPRML